LLVQQLPLRIAPREHDLGISGSEREEPPDELVGEDVARVATMQTDEESDVDVQILSTRVGDRVVDKVQRSRHVGKDPLRVVSSWGVGSSVESSTSFGRERVEEGDLEVVEVLVESEDGETHGRVLSVLGKEDGVDSEPVLIGFLVEGDDRGGGEGSRREEGEGFRWFFLHFVWTRFRGCG